MMCLADRAYCSPSDMSAIIAVIRIDIESIRYLRSALSKRQDQSVTGQNLSEKLPLCINYARAGSIQHALCICTTWASRRKNAPMPRKNTWCRLCLHAGKACQLYHGRLEMSTCVWPQGSLRRLQNGARTSCHEPGFRPACFCFLCSIERNHRQRWQRMQVSPTLHPDCLVLYLHGQPHRFGWPMLPMEGTSPSGASTAGGGGKSHAGGGGKSPAGGGGKSPTRSPRPGGGARQGGHDEDDEGMGEEGESSGDSRALSSSLPSVSCSPDSRYGGVRDIGEVLSTS